MSNNNSNSVRDATTFDFETIKYGQPKVNNLGGKNVKILDPLTNQWLMISTPLMLSFGIGDYVDPQTGVGNGKYEISLLFPNKDYADEETTLFLENIKKLETKIINDALKNSAVWFGKTHKSVDVIEALWTSMLKYSKNNTSPPYIRGKVPVYDGKWKCEIYSEEGDVLFPDDNNINLTPLQIFPAKKKCNIATVLVCGGIWFTNGKFTVTWELAQAVTQKPRESLLGQRKCLIKLKPSQKETLKKQVEEECEDLNEDFENTNTKPNVNTTEDSDGEEDTVVSQETEKIIINENLKSETVVEVQTSTQTDESKKKRIVKKKV